MLVKAALLLAMLLLFARLDAQVAPDNTQRLEQLKWQELADAWNPFASKMNNGVFDVKLWAKVVKSVNAIDGKGCK
jgi:hypothetical protein